MERLERFDRIIKSPLPFQGFDGYYVSTCGRVWYNSSELMQFNGQFRDQNGVPNVLLRPSTRIAAPVQMHPDLPGTRHMPMVCVRVCDLVAVTFLAMDPVKDGFPVLHKDGDRFNNHISNLTWSYKGDKIVPVYEMGPHGPL